MYFNKLNTLDQENIDLFLLYQYIQKYNIFVTIIIISMSLKKVVDSRGRVCSRNTFVCFSRHGFDFQGTANKVFSRELVSSSPKPAINYLKTLQSFS